MSTLLQAEADALRTMPKRLTGATRAEFGMPSAGDGRTYQVESLDGRTAFLIDVNRRGKIKLTRCSYLERYRITHILARLDIDGPPHTNPVVTPPLAALAAHVGATIACPHFHYYVEGFDDRWAVPASEAGFQHTTDLVFALREFMSHCGVEEVPTIQHPMF
ncbi:MAG: hypothetical protein KF805_16340 [Phycisphaeraceae bacterium]|nr:hypothetical protein [Phycisphaeraceae bacterium]